ncbi:MAG: nicotinate-nucleotide adenylyltransferase [Chloroflexaceae bacterium]
MQRIGILGGTFDPVHYGHLAIAEEVRWALGLEQIYVVPAAQQPFKQGQQRANPAQRMEMVQRACAGNPALVPSDVELRRTPPSYTIDTLREFRNRLSAGVTIWFIVGGDALESLPHWYASEEIISLARLAAVGRPGSTPDLARLDAALPGLADATDMVTGPQLDISSTALRRRVAAGQPIRYQVPDTVLAYIVEQRLYQM